MVRVPSAKLDVERASEGGLDDPRIRAGMPAGVAAYHVDRFAGRATDQRRPAAAASAASRAGTQLARSSSRAAANPNRR